MAQRSCELQLSVHSTINHTSHTAKRVTKLLPTIGPYSLNCPLLAKLGQINCAVSKECSPSCSSQLEHTQQGYCNGEKTSMPLIFGYIETKHQKSS